MKGLPDCPHCDCAQTLEAVGVEPRGVRVCECSACSKVCRVDRDGVVVWPSEPRTDISGNLIDGP